MTPSPSVSPSVTKHASAMGQLRTDNIGVDAGQSGSVLVGDTGFEPVTSSVSGKRATTALIARAPRREVEVETGFEPV